MSLRQSLTAGLTAGVIAFGVSLALLLLIAARVPVPFVLVAALSVLARPGAGVWAVMSAAPHGVPRRRGALHGLVAGAVAGLSPVLLDFGVVWVLESGLLPEGEILSELTIHLGWDLFAGLFWVPVVSLLGAITGALR